MSVVYYIGDTRLRLDEFQDLALPNYYGTFPKARCLS